MEAENVCNASKIHDCPHFNYIDPNDPDVDKGEDYVFVGVHMAPQYSFYIQKVADRHFPKDESKKAHQGNKSKAIKELLRYSLKHYRRVEKKGTFQEMMNQSQGEALVDRDKQREKVSQLEEEVEELRSELEKKNQKIKELRLENRIKNDSSDVKDKILELARNGPLTQERIVAELESKDEFSGQTYCHPEKQDTEIGLRGLTDFFLNQLFEEDQLEVTQKNGRTAYQFTNSP